MLRRLLLLAMFLCAPAPAAAHAADPIMPLGEVRSGMRCTGLSVVRGTEISSFDVEVIDVIADDPATGGPRILIRVSGPAVDATGIGPGFSGSPILCDGRNAGAISEGIGAYGNHVVLATPIEEILTARPAPVPASARRAPRIARAARPLLGPLTVGGLSSRTRQLVARAARRSGRVVLAAPPGPVGGYPAVDPRPGSAVGAALSTGDVSIAAVGTVAYRDGDQIYAFAHALDGIGRRALFLQDSYVFSVIGNPIGVPELGAVTYKLTSSGGHALGSFTNDTLSGSGGRLGVAPPSLPLRVTARERGGATVRLDSRLADERRFGLGAGLSFVGPIAAGTALDRLLRTFEPTTLTLCMRFRVRRLRRAIGFCNPYFDVFEAMLDVGRAAGMVDGFDFAPLDIRGAAVSMSARRGVVDDVLVAAKTVGRARPGRRLPVRVTLQRRGGGRRTVTVRVRVPRGLPRGLATLVLSGNGFAADQGLVIELIEGELAGGPGRARSAAAGGTRPRARAARSEPRSVRRLAQRVAGVRRPLGIVARFGRGERRVVLRSDDVRFDGRVKLRLRVPRPRR
ncbi:MAG TPA: hypothetical protein VFY52_03030 [Thermoleophilaceae bacterium]|nr:hypothetical protein [Thermoleophilaceae bacterium]